MFAKNRTYTKFRIIHFTNIFIIIYKVYSKVQTNNQHFFSADLANIHAKST